MRRVEPARPHHRLFAAMYDRMMEANAPLLRPLRQFAAGGASGRVLEIGAGTGLNLAYYDWSRVSALELTEPDPYMLRQARARVSELAAAAQVTTRDSLAEALPFGDEQFDTVVATLVLCTVTDLSRAVSELQRVLKPGGSLRLVEHVRARGFTGTVQRVIQPVYGCVSGGCQLSRDPEHVVRDHGFKWEQVRHTTLGLPIYPTVSALATKPSAGTSSWLR